MYMVEFHNHNIQHFFYLRALQVTYLAQAKCLGTVDEHNSRQEFQFRDPCGKKNVRSRMRFSF